MWLCSRVADLLAPSAHVTSRGLSFTPVQPTPAHRHTHSEALTSVQVLAETQKDSENVKKAWKAFLNKDWKTLENLTSNNAYIRV